MRLCSGGQPCWTRRGPATPADPRRAVPRAAPHANTARPLLRGRARDPPAGRGGARPLAPPPGARLRGYGARPCPARPLKRERRRQRRLRGRGAVRGAARGRRGSRPGVGVGSVRPVCPAGKSFCEGERGPLPASG